MQVNLNSPRFGNEDTGHEHARKLTDARSAEMLLFSAQLQRRQVESHTADRVAEMHANSHKINRMA
ncbi:MAG: hypothetical protein U0003_02945 [Vampirovibrionales bacterium]